MRSRFRSLRPAVTLFALALGATGLHAADGAETAAADQDALAAARRQLDALKVDANSRAAGVGGSALPSISVPQLTTSADASPAPAAPSPLSAADRAKLKRQREAENWLIEGVRKQERADAAATRQPGDRGAASRGATGDSLSRDGSTDTAEDNASDPLTALTLGDDASTDSPTAPQRAERVPAPAATPTPDPLGRFLDGWLSPNDPLRKVATLPSANAGSPRSASDGRADPTSDDAASLAALRDLGLPGGNTGSTVLPSGAPADNPFLSFLIQSPPPAEAAQPANPPPAAVPVLPPTVTPPAADSSSNSPLPDFVRPDDNDKYFKPLKRF